MSFSIVRSHPDLLKYVESLQAANSNALGFLPRVVFEKAAEAGQVFLGLLNGEPAGYILAGSGFQGVLRRKQVAIQYDVRRRLYGAMLVAAVEEYGENLGCVRSEVRCASDLEANEFWASLGYRLIDTQAGGKARGRRINIWSKPLSPGWVATSWKNGRPKLYGHLVLQNPVNSPVLTPGKNGRPRIYASNAERQAAYRARLALQNCSQNYSVAPEELQQEPPTGLENPRLVEIEQREIACVDAASRVYDFSNPICTVITLSLWGVLADDGGSDAGGNCGNGLKDGVHETDYSTFIKFIKDKKMALKLKMTSMWVQPDHWKQFGALAQSQGISASNLLRLMIAKELRRAAREARQDRVGE